MSASITTRARRQVGNVLGRPRREHILRTVPKGGVGAELGVFRGEFSRHILEITRPRELHLVDGWWTLYGETFPDWGWYTDHGKLSTRQAHAETQAIVSKYGKGADVTIHVGSDLEYLEAFPDHHFDWVYLDSGHVYEESLLELAMCDRKVKRNGVIIGDDFTDDPTDINHGLAVAVREFTNRGSWDLGPVDPFRQWRITRKH